MSGIKIVTVVGARPQFIKAATVSRAFASYPNIEEVIVHTGQHYDLNMSQVFFDEMKIPKPRYQLCVAGKEQGQMTGEMMQQLEPVLQKELPDYVLVYGDTNSTLAAALVASKLGIKIVHVEAGLRSGNMKMPEEVNRIVTDRLSSILFCPTELAVKNLQLEGFEHFNCEVIKCGDVMQDGAIFYSKYAQQLEVSLPNKFVLLTIHRAENTNDLQRLSELVGAVNELCQSIPVVMPIHPRTRNALKNAGLQFEPTVLTIEPVGYLQMIWLIKHCEYVMTDSGGLQKEAFFFSKRCITLRDETEWQELVEHGSNILVGTKSEDIIAATSSILENVIKFDFDKDLFGEGVAAKKIVESLLKI